MRTASLAFLLSLLTSSVLAAGTQTATISSTVFTDLGAAPVSVQTLNQPVNICVADLQPSPGIQCFNLQPGLLVTFTQADSSSHVWASYLGAVSVVVYAPTTPSANTPTTPLFVQAGGFDVIVSDSPLVSTSAYSANKVMGGLQTVSIFRTTTRPSGILDYLSVASAGGMTAGVEVWGFTKSPASTCTDSVTFALSSTDLPYLIPGFPILLTPSATSGQTATVASQNINSAVSVANKDTTATANLYFCAVTTGTPTLVSTSDLTFAYAMSQD